MTEIANQIEALAKHSYESDRDATNRIEWKNVSQNTRTSYINEAKDQYEYILEMLPVLGVSPQKVERLIDSLALHMEHSADMVEKLIPLQRENEVLKEERDALEAELNAATEKTYVVSHDEKETVTAFLKLHGVKAGKQLISTALGESSVVQAKASKEDWITIYAKKHGVDALLKACED